MTGVVAVLGIILAFVAAILVVGLAMYLFAAVVVLP